MSDLGFGAIGDSPLSDTGVSAWGSITPLEGSCSLATLGGSVTSSGSITPLAGTCALATLSGSVNATGSITALAGNCSLGVLSGYTLDNLAGLGKGKTLHIALVKKYKHITVA